jgi:hypothetical protein
LEPPSRLPLFEGNFSDVMRRRIVERVGHRTFAAKIFDITVSVAEYTNGFERLLKWDACPTL